MLAMCTCILVVVILEQKIILMGRPLLHIGFPSLLHLLDNYCTVAMFPSPLWAAPTSTITYQHRIAQYLHTIVCCPVIHNTTLITVVRCVHCHTHTCTHTHTHTYTCTHTDTNVKQSHTNTEYYLRFKCMP